MSSKDLIYISRTLTVIGSAFSVIGLVLVIRQLWMIALVNWIFVAAVNQAHVLIAKSITRAILLEIKSLKKPIQIL